MILFSNYDTIAGEGEKAMGKRIFVQIFVILVMINFVFCIIIIICLPANFTK